MYRYVLFQLLKRYPGKFMTKLPLLFALLLLVSCNSTPTPPIGITDQHIQTLHRQFSNATPPPKGIEFQALSKFNITQPELEELSTLYKDSFNDSKDSIDPYAVVEFMEVKGLETLKLILDQKELTGEALKKILPQLDGFGWLASDDNKLFHLYREQALAGSAITYHSILSYRDEKGNSVNYFPDVISENKDNPVELKAFDAIFTIQNEGRTFYLLQGTGVGCNSCASHYFLLVNHQLEVIFNQDLLARFGNVSQFEYEKESKTININYTTDDLLETCECKEEKRLQEGSSCSCTYQFTGKTFELVE